MRILVVGAGIGGLTIALSLHAAGFRDVHIIEARPGASELGVALNLLPHAMREYTELGVGAQIAASGAVIEQLGYYARNGQRIMHEPRGLAAGYRWPQIAIPRALLQQLLLDAVRGLYGRDRIHFGVKLTGFQQCTAGFVPLLSNGDDLPAFDEQTVVIACDGLHSVARKFFYPDHPPPRWNGITMWRGLSLAAPFLDGRSMAMIGSLAKRFVVYPASPVSADGSQQAINWVAEIHRNDADRNDAEKWRAQFPPADAVASFGGMALDFLDVDALMMKARSVYAFPMIDRDPLPRWSFGNVTLLGDAAHPMLPIGSNGASQAVLDARVLARSLACSVGLAAALDAYETQRRHATNALVMANRDAGPEHCMELVAARAPQGFACIHDVLTEDECIGRADRYKELAGFAVDQLNNRASLSA